MAKILRRAVSNLNKAKLTCIDEEPESRTNHHQAGPLTNGRAASTTNKRTDRRSKSRSKKPPSDNKRIDKTAKHLGIEINSTLDRISELDAQNELLMLENQKLRDEIVEMQGKQK